MRGGTAGSGRSSRTEVAGLTSVLHVQVLSKRRCPHPGGGRAEQQPATPRRDVGARGIQPQLRVVGLIGPGTHHHRQLVPASTEAAKTPTSPRAALRPPPLPPPPPSSHRPRPVPVQQGAVSCEISAAMRESPHTVSGSPTQKPRSRFRRSRSSHTCASKRPHAERQRPREAAPSAPPRRGHSPAGADWCPLPSWAAPPLVPPSTAMVDLPLPGVRALGGCGLKSGGGSRIPETPAHKRALHSHPPVNPHCPRSDPKPPQMPIICYHSPQPRPHFHSFLLIPWLTPSYCFPADTSNPLRSSPQWTRQPAQRKKAPGAYQPGTGDHLEGGEKEKRVQGGVQ